VNVASVAGLVPLPGEAAYVASKYAVVGLSQTLRAEAAGLGVQVSTVCPGVVKTPIYDASPVVGFDKERVLALWPKGISADACAARILRGVRRNQAMIVITPTAQVLWRFNRWAPQIFGRAAQAYMRVLRRARVA
jgi:short-subunit dehydrogenase